MPDCPARHIPKSSIMNITNRCFDHSLRFADLLPQNMIHTYRYRKPDACQQPRKPASQPGQETASPVLVFTSGIRAFLFFLCIPARLHHPCLFQVQPFKHGSFIIIQFPVRIEPLCFFLFGRASTAPSEIFSIFHNNFLYFSWIFYIWYCIYAYSFFIFIYFVYFCRFSV